MQINNAFQATRQCTKSYLIFKVNHKNTIIALAIIFNIFGGIGNGINSVATIAVLSSYK